MAGSKIIYDIEIPYEILAPGADSRDEVQSGKVRLKPLNLVTMTLISRAARDDVTLVPVLTIKESLVEPAMGLEQIRQMHIGLVHFLISKINLISGLDSNGNVLENTLNSPLGKTHILLAKHFGWTPEQVSQLTPGQVAIYLAGIEKFLEWEAQSKAKT
uniref:Uncharacterized protein n=1 Tax=Tolypothrix bouteillei VB521301 TaxID=1479485 RepID=A0A0C1RQ20_9CYAN